VPKLQRDPTNLRREEELHRESVQQAKARQSAENLALRTVMQTVEGRHVIWRLLVRAGAFQTSFSQNSMVMAHNEGRKDIGYFLLAQIEQVCPELYRKMADEAEEHKYE